MPRVIFELAPADLVKVLEAPDGVINMIADEMQKQRLDGVVSDQSSTWHSTACSTRHASHAASPTASAAQSRQVVVSTTKRNHNFAQCVFCHHTVVTVPRC